jgi:farnesyl-diphosphate farnesyltransferase
MAALIDTELDRILRGVSRSIFLTLKVAPRRTRRQLAVGYLFCRAADTIADTRLVSVARRQELLGTFRDQFTPASQRDGAATELAAALDSPQAVPEEYELLARLGDCFSALEALEPGDQERIHHLVRTLTQGMALDLARFPPEESGELRALESDRELDDYTYYVAGCVGEFWTELHAAHLPALRHWVVDDMRQRGKRFGQGLQFTNILRDVRADLEIGRCYFPAPALTAAGLTLEDLRAHRAPVRSRELFHRYLRVALGHYQEGWSYTLAIPRRLPRLRLACAWPLLLGLRTLALLHASPDPYAPGSHHKVTRSEVRSILRRSALRVGSNRGLERLYRELAAGLPR